MRFQIFFRFIFSQDLQAAFTRANTVTPTKSATSLEVGEYFPVERMERRTTRFGEQVLVTFTTGQKVWLPQSFSRELRDDVISGIQPGKWELSFQGMQLVGNRYTKARFDVRAVATVVPSQQADWGDDDFTLVEEKSPALL